METDQADAGPARRNCPVWCPVPWSSAPVLGVVARVLVAAVPVCLVEVNHPEERRQFVLFRVWPELRPAGLAVGWLGVRVIVDEEPGRRLEGTVVGVARAVDGLVLFVRLDAGDLVGRAEDDVRAI